MFAYGSDSATVMAAPVPGISEITRILRRRARPIVITTAAVAASALAFVLTVTPLYTATSTVLVEPRHAGKTEAATRSLSGFNADDAVIESQAALINSSSVMQRVVNELNLANDSTFVSSPRWLEWS